MSVLLMSLTRLELSASSIQRALNWWPPFWGAGIRVHAMSADFRSSRVILPLRWFNRNLVGTHFGGSLYSMCDPFYMLQLVHILGPRDFLVWDMAATIRYVRPGRGTVYADFQISDELVESLRQLEPNEKKIVELPVNVYAMTTEQEGGAEGDSNKAESDSNLVASLTKTIYVKRKPLKNTVESSLNDEEGAPPSLQSKL